MTAQTVLLMIDVFVCGVGAAALGFLVKIEHRLTRIETSLQLKNFND